MSQMRERLRIGVLWRGDRLSGELPRADRGLAPLYEAFAQLPVVIEPVPYSDDAVAEVRHQLSTLDGVLVWVNPIQDGANRAQLDPLLREVADRGIWVSAHPDVILRMGTKEVLYRTRDLGWGSDSCLYSSAREFSRRFPDRLARLGRVVVKQGRGNGGNGVWKVELPGGNQGMADLDAAVRVQDARARNGSAETMTLGSFMRQCEDYFSWSGCLVDQAFQDRLADGMLRCYFSHGKVVGFCHQWPRGLLDFDPASPPPDPPPSLMEAPDVPRYQTLRRLVEDSWVPEMAERLDLDQHELPVIWDADFLYGPKDPSGADSFVLCEINVSAVWPFPPMAIETVAANVIGPQLAAGASQGQAFTQPPFQTIAAVLHDLHQHLDDTPDIRPRERLTGSRRGGRGTVG